MTNATATLEQPYTPELPLYLKPRDLAELTGYSVATLTQWRYLGKGPRYIKPGGEGGHVLYRRADVLAWLEGDAA